MSEALIRPATVADLPFLVEAICQAEKGPSEVLSYCNIFGIDEPELRALLSAMLREDIEGQELCISDFLIAEQDGRSVAACCAWVEANAGVASTLLKASVLAQFIAPARMAQAQQYFSALKELYLPRAAGAVQIESVFVAKEVRGRGLAQQLITAQFKRLRPQAPAGVAQVILAANNHAAMATYTRCGFVVVGQRNSESQVVARLLPSASKILMQRPLNGE